MNEPRPPFYVSHILRIFKDNPEGLAIVLYYYSLERDEAMRSLDVNIRELEEMQDGNATQAASALLDIKNAISKTTVEEHAFIRTWVMKKIKDNEEKKK